MLLIALSIGIFALLCLNQRVTRIGRVATQLTAGAAFFAINTLSAFAQEPHRPGGEANLKLPDLSTVTFMGGTNGRTLLMIGIG
ncbi:MAG: hypothetical protein ABI977_24605, partial [Acidobacteriota bacterium]